MKKIDYKIRVFKENPSDKKFLFYVMGADVGGTNTNIAIAGIKNSKPVLLISFDFKSQELESLVPAVYETLSYVDENYKIKVHSACFGGAGVVSNSQDLINLTNVRWNISKKKLIEETKLENIVIINDFQAIGYGLNLLDHKNKKDMLEIRTEKKHEQSSFTKAMLGAGTGLGKSILIYNKHSNIYIPIPSEGGHGDFPAQNDFEIQLLEFIRESRRIPKPVTYEELLSGRGIESIYLFLKRLQKFDTTDYSKDIDKSLNKVNLISKYRQIDETCKETFRLFTKYYARCAKNFVLDTMATGGLYIAGGIALKNKEIFRSNDFLNEFENAYRRSDILKNVPVYIILNYDVSLYGTCLAAIHHSYKNIS